METELGAPSHAMPDKDKYIVRVAIPTFYHDHGQIYCSWAYNILTSGHLSAMLQSSITAWLQKPASVKKAASASDTFSHSRVAPLLPTQGTTSTPDHVSAEVVPEADEIVEDDAVEVDVVEDVIFTKAFALKPLPPNVDLVPLTDELMPAFKRLLALTLPIAYPPAFFAETMTEPHHSITLMAVWHSSPVDKDSDSAAEKPRLVGAIRCRILPSSNLYISTIGLLSPYRSHGIATHLLHRIAVKASKEHGVKCITAHVWEANEEGLEWYKKRGFEIIGREDRYYGKLRPSGAVLVRKWIGIRDLLGNADGSNGPKK